MRDINGNPLNATGKLLTPDQAADFLGFKPGWLARLRCTGGGPMYIRLGRKVRYRLDDLNAWTAERRTASTSAETRAA